MLLNHSVNPRKLSAIDLFSGCGGLTVGLKIAGFQVLAAVEIADKARKTYELNHPEVRMYGEDIRKINVSEILSDIDLKPGDLDLLAGCPPCQGFSRLRTKNKCSSVSDSRNDLVDDFVRFIEELRPKTVMLENVPALLNDHRLDVVRECLERLEYSYGVRVLDAADYGVPQRRKRLILLASRLGSPRIAEKSQTRVTVRDAIAGITARSRSKDRLHSMPERRSLRIQEVIKNIPKNGGSRKDLPIDLQLKCHQNTNGFHDVYGRMAWDDVAPTITSGCFNPSKGRFLHPSYNRTITLREAAVLQGFPETYIFDVSHGKEAIALMIGNALPPPFIAAHATSLRASIEAI